MKCPKDERHALTIKLCDPESPHHARLECPICDPVRWIKWLNEAQVDFYLGNDGETDEVSVLSPEMDAEVRRIVKEELQKALMGLLTPHEGDKL